MGTGTVDTKGRRVAKRITRIMWIILAALFCWAIWKAFLQDIVPRERTLFLSYDSFVDKASNIKNTYPSELPSSAENIRYFHYRGGFDTKTGISFTVSRDEYQELKKTYRSVYLSKEEENRYECKFVFDERVPPEFLAEEELDYLGEVFQNKTDDYTILADKKLNGREDTYYLNGILFNDDTREFVFLHYRLLTGKHSNDTGSSLSFHHSCRDA